MVSWTTGNCEGFHKEILDYLNKISEDPKVCLPALDAMTGRFVIDDEMLYKDPSGINIRTREGLKAVNEAITWVTKEAKPVQDLRWNEGLFKAAKYLSSDVGEAGLISVQRCDECGTSECRRGA